MINKKSGNVKAKETMPSKKLSKNSDLKEDRIGNGRRISLTPQASPTKMPDKIVFLSTPQNEVNKVETLSKPEIILDSKNSVFLAN